MYEILRDNCLITVLLSVSTGPDGDLDDLLADSKDTTKTRKSVTSRGLQGGVTLQDEQRTVIERNDVIDMNWGPVGSAYLIFRTRDGAHREPIRLRLTAPASHEDLQRLDAKPIWSPNDESSPSASSLVAAPDSPERMRRHQLLRELREEILAAEKWKLVEISSE